MLGDGPQELIRAGVVQAKLLVDGLARAHHGPGIVDAEQGHQVAELVERGRLVQVADELGIHPPLVEDPLRRATLRAAGIEVDGGVGHERRVYEADPARDPSRRVSLRWLALVGKHR